MVKLYVHALFALVLMGTATSALESTRILGGSVDCLDGVQASTSTGCHQMAWTESKSHRALRVQAEEPIDPEEPSDPEEPLEPEEPTDPDGPTEPFEPLDPEEPAEEPVEPSEPLDPEQPAEDPPVEPVEPVVPSEDPTDPSVPLGPLEPEAPTEEPVDSEPTDPETPAPSDMYMYSPIGPQPTEPEPTPADEPVDAAMDSVDGTTSPPVATTVAPFTTAPVTAVSAPVCSAKPQKGDQLAGIDIVTDASCLSGGLGCLGTVCRYCKRSDSQTSKHLMPCELIVGTPPSPSTPPSEMPPSQTSPTQADLVCGTWLTPGDRAAGILVANDLNCGKGGVGCVDKVCRYCRAWDTPQAKHMLACSGFASVATPSSPAPSVLANGASCDSLLTTGDRAVGILVASDTNCAKGGVGCIGSMCRYCRTKDTPQSKHLMECSVLSVTAAPAFTFAPLTTTTTTAPTVTGDCTNWSTSGDRSVGIFVATDATCSRGGVGCIRATACRYCRKQDTANSHHLKECSLFSVVSPASAEAVEMEASSVTTQSFATESSGATNASSGLIVSVVGVCVAATVAVAVFTFKRFGAPKHNVEMTTPTFISHRSVSISNL